METFASFCAASYEQSKNNAITTTTIRGSRTGRSKRATSNSGINTPLDFFWHHFPVPTERAPCYVPWLQNATIRNINASKQIFKDQVELFDRQIHVLNLEQLYQLLNNNEPLFGAEYNIIDRYEERDDSLVKLESFLDFHFDSELEKTEFITFLFSLLNKRSGKINCLNIVGPPSSGKTYFARIIKEALITSGQIKNMSKNSSFPFNNCLMKRILHWDEPSFDPSALEDLKMLFSGDELIVAAKYINHQTLRRTPVIVTANMDVFPRDQAFLCRIKKLTFKSCPMLKGWKYLHPMCLFDIFKKYDLLQEEQE